MHGIKRIQKLKSMGQPIDDKFFKDEVKLKKDLTAPNVTPAAREIYDFITENPYTINRGAGMGAESVIAPDMARLAQVGKLEGIDIYRYKEWCSEFVFKQNQQEAKEQKELEKAKKNK